VPRTLRSRIRASTALASGFGLVVAMTIITAFIVSDHVAVRIRQETTARNQLLALTLADDIDTLLEGYFLGLRILDDEHHISRERLDKLEQIYPAFSSVMWISAPGKVVQATSNSTLLGFDVSARDFYVEPVRTGKSYVSPVFIAEGTYAPTTVLAIPSRTGVAVASLDLSSLGNFISALPVRGVASISVTDRNGVLIADQDKGRVSRQESIALEDWYSGEWSAGPGCTVVDTSDKSSELVCWSPVGPRSGWIAIVRESTDQVYASANYIKKIAFFGIFIISSIAMVLILVILFFFDRDIAALRGHTKKLAAGDYDLEFNYDGFLDLMPLAREYHQAVSAVTDREFLLQQNERRLELLLDFLPIPAIVEDKNSHRLQYNRASIQAFGWSEAECPTPYDWWLKNCPDEQYRKAIKAEWKKYIRRLSADKQTAELFEWTLTCKDGSRRIAYSYAANIGDSIVTVIVDNTANREAENRITANLREKEILLKEIHHRVKNNLQIIISLLTLKAGGDYSAGNPFKESIDRINVMAVIHELLYESKDFAHIDLSEYIRTIVEWIASSYIHGPVRPAIKLELQPIELDIDAAIPCGLIINELFTNAVKYAFDASALDPAITIRTSLDAPDLVQIQLADNGKGLPDTIDPSTADSLGLQLIISLVSQLKGSWEVDRGQGTDWKIRFTRKKTC